MTYRTILDTADVIKEEKKKKPTISKRNYLLCVLLIPRGGVCMMMIEMIWGEKKGMKKILALLVQYCYFYATREITKLDSSVAPGDRR